VSYRKSYWVTTAASSTLVAAAVGITTGLTRLPHQGIGLSALEILLACGGLLAALVAVAGCVVLWRDGRDRAGRPDSYARYANHIPSPHSPFRFLLGSKLRPGDLVRVKSIEEIRATLDENGRLDALPFMPEMEQFCGKQFRVHRRIDKINDMRHKTGLRRMRDAVTLTAVRCDGAAHGGCQAECQILWKDAWLEGLPATRPRPAANGGHWPAEPGPDAAGVYVCQMTELWHASTPMSAMDIRQDLRAWLSGNIALRGFLLGLFTRLFNAVQRARKGASYPFMENQRSGPTPASTLGLSPADRVAVLSREEVLSTLVNGRNRGLWFDREMIRFCKQPGTVLKRVDRVIHEGTGKMVVMKTPCVVLKETIATGEFLRFCPQHEYIFWRENWLRPLQKD
jgi:hypothetical protein